MIWFGFIFCLLATTAGGFVIDGVEDKEGSCLMQEICSECLSPEGKQGECIFAQIGSDDLVCLPATYKDGTRAFLERESDCDTLKGYSSIQAMKAAATSKQRRDADVGQATLISSPSPTIQQTPTTTPMTMSMTETEGTEQTISTFVEPEQKTTILPTEEWQVELAPPAPEVQLFTWTIPEPFVCDDNIDWLRTNLERSFCRTMVYYKKVGRQHLSHTLLANYYTNPASGQTGHCDYLFWMRKNCKMN